MFSSTGTDDSKNSMQREVDNLGSLLPLPLAYKN